MLDVFYDKHLVPMIIILIPSRFEAKAFIAGLEGRRAFRVGGADCVEGRGAGEVAVTVGIIGMGPPHAALRAKAVIEECRRKNAECRMEDTGSGKQQGGNLAKSEISDLKLETRNSKPETRNPKPETESFGVILCGFAGALKPELKRGEIFVTAGAEFLLPLLPEAERPREAKLATVGKLAGTAAGKAELFARTGAWLCDMEQAHIAPMVAAMNLPLIGIRIVSDEAHEELPTAQLAQAYDQETGTETPWKLAGHLARNPLRTVTLVSFVRPLPSIRSRMSDRLHTWLRLTGPRLFQP
jgi:hypothetical protein